MTVADLAPTSGLRGAVLQRRQPSTLSSSTHKFTAVVFFGNMFCFTSSTPAALRPAAGKRAVCRQRGPTTMVAADIGTRMVAKQAEAPPATEKKSMSYQNKEYSAEEIEALKKKRQLMFVNRKVRLLL